MGFFVLLLLIIGVIVIISASSSGQSSGGYHGGYARDYDDYEDFEIRAARGDMEYFSDDPAQDYNSYYAQVAVAADMGDQDAIDEMYGEFGDEW